MTLDGQQSDAWEWRYKLAQANPQKLDQGLIFAKVDHGNLVLQVSGELDDAMVREQRCKLNQKKKMVIKLSFLGVALAC